VGNRLRVGRGVERPSLWRLAYGLLSDTLACYLPETDTTDKACLVVEDVLRHRAGLQPWIPFYEETVSERTHTPLSNYYRHRPRPPFDIRVTGKLFLLGSYRDSIWNKILLSPLRKQPGYKYSDLGLYLMAASPFRAYLRRRKTTTSATSASKATCTIWARPCSAA